MVRSFPAIHNITPEVAACGAIHGLSDHTDIRGGVLEPTHGSSGERLLSAKMPTFLLALGQNFLLFVVGYNSHQTFGLIIFKISKILQVVCRRFGSAAWPRISTCDNAPPRAIPKSGNRFSDKMAR